MHNFVNHSETGHYGICINLIQPTGLKCNEIAFVDMYFINFNVFFFFVQGKMCTFAAELMNHDANSHEM